MTFPEPEFERVFRLNYERLVASLTAMTGDREVARDCVQEAFIKASTRWRRVRRYDDPVAWIRRVAINRSRDVNRSDRRRRDREQRSNPHRTESSVDGVGPVEGSMQLVELLRALPEQQRAAAVLFYVEDLPIAQIAVTLGISGGTVKYHLSQARASLRVALEREGRGNG